MGRALHGARTVNGLAIKGTPALEGGGTRATALSSLGPPTGRRGAGFSALLRRAGSGAR